MKRIIVLMVVLLLSFSLVLAGESYDLDFSEGTTQAFSLYDGDEVRFEMYGAMHSIIVSQVNPTSIDFKVVPYMDNSSEIRGGYVTLDTIAKVDLEMDNVADVVLALYSVNGETGEVTLVIQQNVEDTQDVDSGVVEEVEPMPQWKSTLLKVIAVCVIILVVFYIFRGKTEKEEDNLTAEEEKEVEDLLEKVEEVGKED